MKTARPSRSLPLRIARGVALVFLLISGFILLDHLPSLWNDISPPADLVTIDDFREWKGDRIGAEGIYEQGGETYTVILGESGAFLASGPAAYVFDSDGLFVDWTGDMGDAHTRKRGFDLTSGNVILRRKNKL